MKHFLNLEHVTGPSVGAGFNHKLNEIGILLIGDDFASFHGSLTGLLLAKI